MPAVPAVPVKTICKKRGAYAGGIKGKGKGSPGALVAEAAFGERTSRPRPRTRAAVLQLRAGQGQETVVHSSDAAAGDDDDSMSDAAAGDDDDSMSDAVAAGAVEQVPVDVDDAIAGRNRK